MDHLLRTLASVPPSTRILIVGQAPDSAVEGIRLLGFEVIEAPPATHEDFEWAVLFLRLSAWHACAESLTRIRPFVRPGGWVYVAVELDEFGGTAMSDVTENSLPGTGYALAEEPTYSSHVDQGRSSVRFIVRSVDDTTIP